MKDSFEAVFVDIVVACIKEKADFVLFDFVAKYIGKLDPHILKFETENIVDALIGAS